MVILLREEELGRRKVKQLPTFAQLVVTELELGLASALLFSDSLPSQIIET